MRSIGKRLINGSPESQRQLEPLAHPWAYRIYLQQQAQYWLPTEVPMGEDVAHFQKLNEKDKEAIKRCLALFSTFEFAVADNIAVNLYRLLTSPEVRMALLAQGNMEAVHQQAYSFQIETLGVDKDFSYNAHKDIAVIASKIQWCEAQTRELSDPDFKPDSKENKRKLLLNILAFLLTEGVSFMGGFAILLSFSLRGIMPGIVQQISYIARDEGLHCAFATKLAVELINEEPSIWNGEVAEKMIEMANDVLEAEYAFCRFCIGEGIPNLSMGRLKQHLMYLANRRLDPFGLSLKGATGYSPLKWLSEVLELPREKNFFETRVMDYTKGGLRWD